MSGRLFAFGIAGMSLLAAIFYGLEGDTRRCVYWIGAVMVTWAATV